jgi:hypothetical protein
MRPNRLQVCFFNNLRHNEIVKLVRLLDVFILSQMSINHGYFAANKKAQICYLFTFEFDKMSVPQIMVYASLLNTRHKY